MRKSILLLLVLLPGFAFAQLDKIKPGMSLPDMQKLFPSMSPDLVGMTSTLYGDDTLGGLQGKGTWIIMRDTLRSYQFASVDVLGPCDAFANADSSANHKLMKKANELLTEYTDLFGAPTLIAPDKNTVGSKYLFYREWKTQVTDVVLAVARPSYSGIEDMPNAPNAPYHPKQNYDCYYKLSVQVSGSSEKIGWKFGVGTSQQDFVKKHPKLSPQIVDYPDKWTMRDTLDTNYGTWRFSFVNGKLSAFTLDIYDGAIYKNQAEQAYALLLGRCKTLTKEMKKNYGKPDDFTSASDKYQKRDLKIYYSDIEYQARWNKVEGQSMVIRLNEAGGGKQGAPVFHLEVIWPAVT
ncbi:MAG TPA: hypothetical protein VL651_10285 [Bacteroidia bacterium]|jgi:hypothetical protein|nr:hypothetical protein [Bacteroidia bacterium]